MNILLFVAFNLSGKNGAPIPRKYNFIILMRRVHPPLILAALHDMRFFGLIFYSFYFLVDRRVQKGISIFTQ